eukprot:GHVT01075875.1.p1 GENE.GHVT01075875.1~~GHVT01075875.1.p1  ORF type:complete len:679 (+),score=59.26 GHVT01075875.1:57-2093(+)
MLFTWTSSRVCPRNRFGIYSSSITAHHSEHPPVVGLLKYPSAMAHTHEGVAASLEVESTVTESAICREKLSHATRAAVGDVPSNNSRLLIASGNKHWLPSARNFLRSNCFIIFIVILVALGVLVLFAAFRSTVIPQLSWGENQAILLNAAHDGLFTKFYKWTLTPENAKEAQRLAPMLMKFCFRKAAEPVSLLVTLSLVSSSRSSLPSPFDFSRASSRRLVYSSDHFSPAPPSLPFDQVYNPSSVLLPACDSCTKLISALPPSFSAQTIQSILPHDDQPACRAALATLAGGKTMVDISDRSRVARDDIADTRAVDGSLAADACRLLPERREAVREVDRQRRIRELIDKGVEDKGSSMNSEPISLKDGATREDLQIAAFKISFYIAPIDMFPSNRQAQAQKTSERIRSAAIPTTSGAFGEAWILENGNVDDETHGSAATQPVDMAGEDTETRQSINNETQTSCLLLPVLVYIHGGGMAFFDHHSYDKLLRKHSTLAAAHGAVVMSIDYRTSPQFPFPAGLLDCLAGLDFLHAHGTSLGLDISRLLIFGDSAGGNLAMAATLVAAASPAAHPWLPNVRALGLVYPAICRSCSTRSNILHSRAFTLNHEASTWFGLMYHHDLLAMPTWQTSPLLAPDELLSYLPPTYIVAFTHDIHYDASVLLHERLRRVGVYTGFYSAPG